MIHNYVLDADGEPVVEPDILRWAEWFETADRHVAETLIGHEPTGAEVRVSTVFLGLDHGWGDGPPVLWETMTFGLRADEPQWRYTSKADAIVGHARAVEQCRDALILRGGRAK